MASLNRFCGNCNTLDDSCARVCVLNKRGDVDVKVFNMITKINEVKTLVRHWWSCDCKWNLMQKTVIQSKME